MVGAGLGLAQLSIEQTRRAISVHTYCNTPLFRVCPRLYCG